MNSNNLSSIVELSRSLETRDQVVRMIMREKSLINHITILFWLQELRRYKKEIPLDFIESHQESEILIYNTDLNILLSNVLAKISKDCQKILTLWSYSFRLKEIARKMNVESAKYMKKKKSLCLKKLVALLEANPQIKKELKNYV